jgi:hypothetical protein
MNEDNRFRSVVIRINEQIEDTLRSSISAVEKQTKVRVFGSVTIFMGSSAEGRLPMFCFCIERGCLTKEVAQFLARSFMDYCETLPEDLHE